MGNSNTSEASSKHGGRRKVILVAGAGSGIGHELALSLIEHDRHIVYCVDDHTRWPKLLELEIAGGRVIAFNEGDEPEIEAMVKRIARKHGRIDVLLNNSGFSRASPDKKQSVEDARRNFDANLTGLANFTNWALPVMRETGRGTIINICNVGGKIYKSDASWYAATKHSMEGWSDCLRLELRSFNIRTITSDSQGVLRSDRLEIKAPLRLDTSRVSPFQSIDEKFARRESHRGCSPSTLASIVISKASECNNRRYNMILVRA